MSANRIAELLELRRENAVLRAQIDRLKLELGENGTDDKFYFFAIPLVIICMAGAVGGCVWIIAKAFH